MTQDKSWEELTNDELIRELFPQEVVEAAQEVTCQVANPDNSQEASEEG